MGNLGRDWSAGQAMWPVSERWGPFRVNLRPDGTTALVDRRLASGLMLSSARVELSYREFLHRASGRVLCFGLGMGWSLAPLLLDPSIELVEVVEIDPLLLEWVGPRLSGLPRSCELRLHLGSAWNWEPSQLVSWNTIFLDVWHSLPLQGLEELRSRWLPHLAEGGWLGSWSPATAL